MERAENSKLKSSGKFSSAEVSGIVFVGESVGLIPVEVDPLIS